MVVAEPVASSVVSPWGPHVEGRLKIMIAGGGIGGLCTALVLQNQGHDVHIYEKATSYRPFGGPIQIASNALESLKRIDQNVYNAILEQSTSIGTRKNGLKDGLSNEWFATFDLYAPARRRNQDSSVVIDRPILQEILLQGIGRGTVSNGCEVTGYTKHQYSAPGNSVTGLLSNGSSVQCDLLIGSDGINSKVREKLVPRLSDPVWSGYTCFAAIANCVPDDIKDVGYKVFLGSRKYFVSVDVGGGRIQWYAFLNLPPNSLSLKDGEESINFLRDEFKGWSPEVEQLLGSTAFDQIEQRDLFDRAPEFKRAHPSIPLIPLPLPACPYPQPSPYTSLSNQVGRRPRLPARRRRAPHAAHAGAGRRHGHRGRPRARPGVAARRTDAWRARGATRARPLPAEPRPPCRRRAGDLAQCERLPLPV